jgi:Domain of unknown function (DUF4287)
MTNQTAPWPKKGPASYFPSIEKKYGRPIAEWQKVITASGPDMHMAIVGHLKSEYGMGHGHTTNWTLCSRMAHFASASWDSKASSPVPSITFRRIPRPVRAS